MEEILHDVKQRYDDAVQLQQHAEAATTTAEEAIHQLQVAMDQKQEHVRRLCQELKSICPFVNLLNEFYATLEMMRMQAHRAQTVQARA